MGGFSKTRLDDPVDDYLPELASRHDAAGVDVPPAAGHLPRLLDR